MVGADHSQRPQAFPGSKKADNEQYDDVGNTNYQVNGAGCHQSFKDSRSNFNAQDCAYHHQRAQLNVHMPQGAVTFGCYDGFPGHMRQVCAHDEVHGYARPKHHRTGNESSSNPKEAPQDANQETDASQKKRVYGHPRNGKVHNIDPYSSRLRFSQPRMNE